jgi:ATPase subunit of ABC transporter with duplicated ATPase domains
MPATLLQATSISKSLGRVVVLDDVDLRADSASRIGLIGPNGAGKSTLLRIAAGLERPDGGEVRRHGLIGYLPQVAGGSESVWASIWRRIGLLDAERELSRLEARLEAGELEAVEAHGDALAQWVALGGEDAEARVTTALAGLGLGTDLLERSIGSLSGGQMARAGLAALQAARFDLLLLDEPTNHLDADGLERFRQLLREGGRPFVMVSHDRALLEESVEEIVELDGPSGSAEVYGGGWSAYERERRLRERRERDAHETAVAERERAVAVEREIRRRASRMSSRMRSRPADGDKNSREWVRSRADGAAGRARKIGERAKRIDVPPAPWRPPRLRLTVEASEAGAGEIALEEVVLRRGAFELGPLSLQLALGERLSLEGLNASGKSTLLAALAPVSWSRSPAGSVAAPGPRSRCSGSSGSF